MSDKITIKYFDQPLDYYHDVDIELATELKQNFENEQRTMYFIETGDLDKFKEYMDKSNFNIYLGYSSIPLANERALASRALGLASSAAVRGGLDYAIAYSLIYKYQNLIETINCREQLFGLSYDIVENFCQAVHWTATNKTTQPALLPILKYINRNLNRKLTVEEIASKMNMNSSYLSHMFKREMGVSLTDYINEHKIQLAKQLMKTTSMSLAQISNYLDFSSQSYFNNIFKKYSNNQTPKKYYDLVKNI